MGLGSVLGSAVGAAGSILGGSLSDSRNASLSNSMWDKNYSAQKEFAQNSIQWRVQDAKKAGIHPLYAMGNTPGYTPQDASYQSSYGQGVSQAMNRIGEAMGQLDLTQKREEVKGQKLDNASKAVALANEAIKSNLGQTPKIFPNPVQGVTGGKLISNGSGGVRIVPDTDDFEATNLPAIAQAANTMFDRDSHSALSKVNKSDLAFGLTGYDTIPKNSNSYWDRVRKGLAADEDMNDFFRMLSIPSAAIVEGLRNIFGDDFMDSAFPKSFNSKGNKWKGKGL